MSAHEDVRLAALALGEALHAGVDATMERMAYEEARERLDAEQAEYAAIISSCRDSNREANDSRS